MPNPQRSKIIVVEENDKKHVRKTKKNNRDLYRDAITGLWSYSQTKYCSICDSIQKHDINGCFQCGKSN